MPLLVHSWLPVTSCSSLPVHLYSRLRPSTYSEASKLLLLLLLLSLLLLLLSSSSTSSLQQHVIITLIIVIIQLVSEARALLRLRRLKAAPFLRTVLGSMPADPWSMSGVSSGWIASLHVDYELTVTSCMSSEMQKTCLACWAGGTKFPRRGLAEPCQTITHVWTINI